VIAVHPERGDRRGSGRIPPPGGLRRGAPAAKAARSIWFDAVSEHSCMVAIGVILLFVAVFAIINRIEFGRFD
jgi:hypothetical protein